MDQDEQDAIREQLEDLDELPEVPPIGFSDPTTRDVSDAWIEHASPKEQVAAMVEWFSERFEDPAQETPYMSSEGGYIWINGGPYDATEQIEGRFSGLVSEAAIEAAVEWVQQDGIYDWAPTQLTYYDEEQDLVVDDKDMPLHKLQGRLASLLAVLGLQGDAASVDLARNLAYAGVITALETFLWESMAYWVAHDPQTVRNLISEHPAFKGNKILLGDIFKIQEHLGVRVKAHIQHMTWHRWDDAAKLLKIGLGIEPPSFRTFEEPTKKRHDVIHRSGHDVEGNAVNIVDDDVRALATAVAEFAAELHRMIDAAKMPPNDEF